MPPLVAQVLGWGWQIEVAWEAGYGRVGKVPPSRIKVDLAYEWDRGWLDENRQKNVS